MKVVFFGTPDDVVPILEALSKNYQIVAVVTQPPKPAGRGRKLTYSAVDTWGYKHKVPVVFDQEEIPTAELGILAAYGKIVPQRTINKFKYGILNIHPSLLPKYRGASPIQAAIVNGDGQTGVTVIKLDSQMDHGPIVSQFREEIAKQDTAETLRQRLFGRAAKFLVDLIPYYVSRKITPKEQAHKEATYTKTLTREDGLIDFKDINQADRLLRAYHPWPGVWAWVTIDGVKRRLKILSKDSVQLEGKKPVSLQQFSEAYRFS